MTDKEIIEIDGINVLECEHYQYKSLKDCEMRYPESGDCEIGLLNYLFDGNLDMEKSCKDNPNCYYKQLARKTQECEELKEKLNTVQFNFEQKCNVLKDIGVVQDNNGGYQIPELNRYRKALEEIQILAGRIISNDDQPACVYDVECPLNGGVGFDNHCNENCPFVTAKQILNIINKAKGGNNEMFQENSH